MYGSSLPSTSLTSFHQVSQNSQNDASSTAQFIHSFFFLFTSSSLTSQTVVLSTPLSDIPRSVGILTAKVSFSLSHSSIHTSCYQVLNMIWKVYVAPLFISTSFSLLLSLTHTLLHSHSFIHSHTPSSFLFFFIRRCPRQSEAPVCWSQQSATPARRRRRPNGARPAQSNQGAADAPLVC